MNRDQRAEIYSSILTYRQYPEEFFLGTPDRLTELRTAIVPRAY